MHVKLHLTVYLMQGTSALHYAAVGGRMHVVVMLLTKGADVYARDDEVTLTLLSNCEHSIRWQQYNTFSCMAP